jgi:hypothetical protein
MRSAAGVGLAVVIWPLQDTVCIYTIPCCDDEASRVVRWVSRPMSPYGGKADMPRTRSNVEGRADIKLTSTGVIEPKRASRAAATIGHSAAV